MDIMSIFMFISHYFFAAVRYAILAVLLVLFLYVVVELLFEALVNIVKSLKVQYPSSMILFSMLLYILSYIPLICVLTWLHVFREYINTNAEQTIHLYASGTSRLYIIIITLAILWNIFVGLINDKESLVSFMKSGTKSVLFISILFNIFPKICEEGALGAYNTFVNILIDSNYHAKMIMLVCVILFVNLLVVQYMHNIMPHVFGGDVFTLKNIRRVWKR